MKTLKQILAESPVPRYVKDNTMGDSRSQMIFLYDNFKSSKKVSTYDGKNIYYVLTSDKKHVFFVLTEDDNPKGLLAYAEFVNNTESKKIPGFVISYYWKAASSSKGIISFIFTLIIKNTGGLLSDYSQTVEANNLWKKFILNEKNKKFHFYIIELLTDVKYNAIELDKLNPKATIDKIDSVFKVGSKFYDYRFYASTKKL